MKIQSNAGGIVEIGEERAKRLLESSDWFLPSEVSEPVEDTPEGQDTGEAYEAPSEDAEAPEEGTERPDASVVRAWAKENGVEVNDKGRVRPEVYAQYAEAHKN